MDYLREQIYLAGLLHDIGKFFQRADSGSVEKSKLLTDDVKRLVSQYCPLKNDGRYTHKHVIWTAGFISKYSRVFNNLLKDGQGLRSNLLEYAASHHLSADQLRESPARFIRQADHLSSGMDRSTDAAFKDEQEAENWDAFKKKRMVSVFEGLGHQGPHTFQYHLPVDSLNLRADWFPRKSFDSDPDYASLWQRFEAEFKFIQADDFRAFSETLLNLLQKYTTSVPSSTIHLPDVSLFDHLKTTAALAVCLYDKSLETGDAGSDTFLMIGGDFSGIQNYIYNIQSKQAAKNLKGRSFYIKLLSDAVVYYLLKELNLFHGNVIYNAGGSFYLLAPNTAWMRAKFEECKRNIEEKILQAHGTSLYIALDTVTFGEETLLFQKGKTLSDAWQQLFDRRNAAKKHRYADMLTARYDYFFTPSDQGGDTIRDAVTGEELSKQKAKAIGDGDTNEYIGELTWKQILLGRKLREAQYIVISDGPLTYWKNHDAIDPAGLGFYFYFLSQKEIEDKREALKGSANRVRIITLNANERGDCDFLNSAVQGYNNIFGFDFLGGNDFPKDDDGYPLTFDKLAGESDLKRLGFLRMDVDNLGMLFRSGFPKEMITLSRYSSLSRNLDWFFKGYINTIWKERYSDSSYIIYSGGDDLFLIGRWDKVLDFGRDIREAFKNYVCNNPFLSLSGGMAIVSGKFPVKKASADSESMEKKAKSYFFEFEQNGNTQRFEKSAVTLMGLPLNWDHEFPVVMDLQNKMVQLLAQKKLPKAFISKLSMHYSMSRNITDKSLDDKSKDDKPKKDKMPKNNNVVQPKVLWMMAYDFGRMVGRYTHADVIDLVKQCQRDIFSNTIQNQKIKTSYHALDLWNLAARLAELQLRTMDISNS